MTIKKWLILALCLVVGCPDTGSTPDPSQYASPRAIINYPGFPVEVKIVNVPDAARIEAMEKRIEVLEEWAGRMGRRIK